MTWVAVAIGGAAVIGGVVASNSASKAANAQVSAAQGADQLQADEFNKQQENAAPYMGAGYQALKQMQDPQFQHQFGVGDFQQDPAYQFNLTQGMNALQNSAAARGGLMSGNTLTGISQYSQGMANNEYQQAFNNFNTSQSNSFNRLASIAGLGQTANAQMGAAGQNMANQIGNNMMGAGNAQGAAAIANGNAWGSAINGVANAGATYGMMNRYGSTPNYGYGDTGGGTLSGIGSGGGSGYGVGSNNGGSVNFSGPNPYAT